MKMKQIKLAMALLCLNMASISSIIHAGHFAQATHSLGAHSFEPAPRTFFEDQGDETLQSIAKHLSFENLQIAGKLAAFTIGTYLVYKGANKILTLHNEFLLKDKFDEVISKISNQKILDEEINDKITTDQNLVEQNTQKIKDLGKQISDAGESVSQLENRLNPIFVAFNIDAPPATGIDAFGDQLTAISNMQEETSNLLAQANTAMGKQNEQMLVQFNKTKKQLNTIKKREKQNTKDHTNRLSHLTDSVKSTTNTVQEIQHLIANYKEQKEHVPQKLQEFIQQLEYIGIAGTDENRQFVQEVSEQVVQLLLENARAARQLESNRIIENNCKSNEDFFLDID